MVTVVLPDSKAALRRRLLAARRLISPEVHSSESTALAAHLRHGAIPADATVCVYMPVGTEPGSATLVESLHHQCSRVLLPVTRVDASGVPLPLEWGKYAPGALVPGRYGLSEPARPWLPATAIAEAAVILVPALAVDRSGARLGRGGGYYDRSLPLRSIDSIVIAVVRDDEIIDELPSESHDVRMTHALCPGQGLIAINNAH